MLRIVLTGGPCAGKTTLLRILTEHFAYEPHVYFTKEVARSLLAKSNYDLSIASERVRFQTEVFVKQLLSEQIAISKYEVLVLDRGLLDGAAYWQGGRAAFLAHFQLDLSKVIARYGIVFHLESLALGTHYEQDGIRSESKAEAMELENKTKEVWRGHPRRFILPHRFSIAKKASFIIETIEKELERAHFDMAHTLKYALPLEQEENAISM